MRNTFIDTLIIEARQNNDIVLITGDLGYGVLDRFASEFPDRYINSGISEQSMMGLAAGLASMGKKVFVYSIGNFPTLRCLEQIRNDVCLMNNDVCIVAVGAGYAYGAQGYSHHTLEDIAVLRSMPNLQIVAPADSIETVLATKYLSNIKGPSYLRLGKESEDIVPGRSIMDITEPQEIRSGSDGVILFTGDLGHVALDAGNQLSNLGVSISIFSVPFIKNMSSKFIMELSEFPRILTLEEHITEGGFGSLVLERVSALDLSLKLKVIGATRDKPSLIGDQNYLRVNNGISSQNIVNYFIK